MLVKKQHICGSSRGNDGKLMTWILIGLELDILPKSWYFELQLDLPKSLKLI